MTTSRTLDFRLGVRHIGRWRIYLTALVWAFLAAPGAGDQQREEARETIVVELRHRVAEQVVRILLPHVPALGVTLSGSGNRLFVQGPVSQIGQLEELITTADQPRRRLMITVAAGVLRGRDGNPGPAQRPASAQVADGGAEIATFRTKRRDPLPTLSPDPGPSTGLRTRERADGQNVQQVAVLEGQWARVLRDYWGASTRFPVEVVATPGVRVLLQAAENDSRQAFSVRAFLIGDSVTVDIAFFEDRLGGGTGQAKARATETSLKGRLGQWLLVIPAEFSPRPQPPSGTAFGTAPRQLAPQATWVRIDALEN